MGEWVLGFKGVYGYIGYWFWEIVYLLKVFRCRVG